MDETGAKITELGSILGSDVDGADLLTTVDVSDTSMALTGTNKKLTIEELGKVPQTLTNKTLTSPVFTGAWSGWISAGRTWEFVSVDNPTGIFRVNADVTTELSVGMKIRFVNATHTIYGKITAVGSYSGGYTNITFLHQMSANVAVNLMENSAITNNYYSTQYAPYGFPLAETNWQIKITGIARNITGASAGTYYACPTTIYVPIGRWKSTLEGQLGARFVYSSNGTADTFAYVGLSNNSGSISGQTASFGVRRYNVSGSVSYETMNIRTQDDLNLSAKTPYYVVGRATESITDLWLGSYGPFTVTLTCSY